jgi:hypothetical protein
MPIDKRKMTNIINHPTRLPTMSFPTNTIYLFLIFTGLAWNAYNTYQYQILAERQTKLENMLAEMLPSSSSYNPIQTVTTSSIEQWFTKVRDFIRQLTSKDLISNSSNTITAKPYTVRSVFLEMPFESLDTCIYIYI